MCWRGKDLDLLEMVRETLMMSIFPKAAWYGTEVANENLSHWGRG